MIEELKEIRKRLEDAVTSRDWWTVKAQMNKIDTIIYNDYKSKVKNLKNGKAKDNFVKHFVSRLIMPRLNWGHFAIIFFAIVPNMITAVLMNSIIPAIVTAVWLIIPCRDKQFGNGKKYYWVRQSVFIAGTLITVIMVVA